MNNALPTGKIIGQDVARDEWYMRTVRRILLISLSILVIGIVYLAFDIYTFSRIREDVPADAAIVLGAAQPTASKISQIPQIQNEEKSAKSAKSLMKTMGFQEILL